MKIVAIIPARGGSKGIPEKNIKELSGQPLIGYSILDGLRSKWIDETFVTSDSIKILKTSILFGSEVVQRPTEFATDNSKDIEWALHFISWYKNIYRKFPDYIVLLRPTTPIREIELIDKAIEEIIKHPEASSLRSVELIPESPYKYFDLKDGYLYPLLNNDFEVSNIPRQECPKVYRPNGYVDILKPKTLLTKSINGTRILPFITPRSVEIDTIEDFEYAEYLITKRSNG